MLYIVPFATSKFGIGELEASKSLSIMGIAELLFKVPWGYIADWRGVNKNYILCAICVGLGLSMIMVVLSTSYVMMTVACGFVGVFQVRKLVIFVYVKIL